MGGGWAAAVADRPSRRRPTQLPAPLLLLDRSTGLRIVPEADLPAEAHRQLTALDLGQFGTGPVHYDLARGRWRSGLDGAAPPTRP